LLLLLLPLLVLFLPLHGRGLALGLSSLGEQQGCISLSSELAHHKDRRHQAAYPNREGQPELDDH